MHTTDDALVLSGLTSVLPTSIRDGNRILVTSRPYGLSDPDVARLELPFAPIRELDDELQSLLVRRWFRALADDERQADETAQEMLAQTIGPHPGSLSSPGLLLD